MNFNTKRESEIVIQVSYLCYMPYSKSESHTQKKKKSLNSSNDNINIYAVILS